MSSTGFGSRAGIFAASIPAVSRRPQPLKAAWEYVNHSKRNEHRRVFAERHPTSRSERRSAPTAMSEVLCAATRRSIPPSGL
jgi:hypothetical protein